MTRRSPDLAASDQVAREDLDTQRFALSGFNKLYESLYTNISRRCISSFN